MNENQETVSQWLKAVGSDLGQELGLSEDGHCTIFFGQDSHCIVEVPGEKDVSVVFVYIPMLRLPDDPAAQNSLLRAALEINLFGIGTGGGHVSLDSRSESIVLSFSADLKMMDEDLFKQVLGDLLDVGTEIISRLRDVASETLMAGAETGSPGDSDVPMMRV